MTNLSFRVVLAFFLCMGINLSAFAQPVSGKSKVAIYSTFGSGVDADIKNVINSYFVTAITNSKDYVVVERNEDFITAMSQEGAYALEDIVKVGKDFKASYVVVIDISKVFGEYFVATRLIDVNVGNGNVIKAYSASGTVNSMNQLKTLAQDAVNGLLSNATTGRRTNEGGTGSGGNVETFTVNGVTFEMVRVDGGSYQMGSYSGYNDEQPVHTETVNTFYIGKTEVTQRLWSAVMGNNPSHFRGENLPVEMVSWYDCQEFVDRLSRLTGRVFRLPTEAEWEYAARGGNKSRGYTYSGSEDVYRVAWYDENSGGTTHPVGQKLDNELGIFDMSGNVWEWCSDNYSNSYAQPRNSSNRVLRGGFWNNLASFCRVAYRSDSSPGDRNNRYGLRLAL